MSTLSTPRLSNSVNEYVNQYVDHSPPRSKTQIRYTEVFREELMI